VGVLSVYSKYYPQPEEEEDRKVNKEQGTRNKYS